MNELSWEEERNFWFKRLNRAFIRFQDATKRGDKKAEEIAHKQHSLYKRRFDAVIVPKEIREKQAQERAAERCAALNEI